MEWRNGNPLYCLHKGPRMTFKLKPSRMAEFFLVSKKCVMSFSNPFLSFFRRTPSNKGWDHHHSFFHAPLRQAAHSGNSLRVCQELRRTKQDDYLQFLFDHFWRKLQFFVVARAVSKMTSKLKPNHRDQVVAGPNPWTLCFKYLNLKHDYLLRPISNTI